MTLRCEKSTCYFYKSKLNILESHLRTKNSSDLSNGKKKKKLADI